MDLAEALKVHFANLRFMDGPAFAGSGLTEAIDDLERLVLEEGSGKEGIVDAEGALLCALTPYESAHIIAAAASGMRRGGRSTQRELMSWAREMRQNHFLIPNNADATRRALEIVAILENPLPQARW